MWQEKKDEKRSDRDNWDILSEETISYKRLSQEDKQGLS